MKAGRKRVEQHCLAGFAVDLFEREAVVHPVRFPQLAGRDCRRIAVHLGNVQERRHVVARRKVNKDADAEYPRRQQPGNLLGASRVDVARAAPVKVEADHTENSCCNNYRNGNT